ncbi:MAG: tripartite tricarboxylate transporter TctB family protein [Pseudomonadota bacterium]
MNVRDQEARRAGGLIFALLFLAVSLLLVWQLEGETKFSAKGQLAAQPAFWPAIGVIGMAVFGGLHALGEWRQRDARRGLGEVAIWLRSFEYLAWFMAYVFAVPIIGYLPTTLIFAVTLAFRAGYRSPKLLGAAALMGVGVVLIFKTFLSVKIPGGALYEYLPDGLRSAALIYF